MEVVHIFNFLLILAAITSSSADDYRLPTTTYPIHYELHFNVPASTFTASSNEFLGTAQITFQAAAETTQIKLHANSNYILITEIRLNDQVIPEADYSRNATTDTLTIDYSSGLVVGTDYSLKIEYVGQLSVTDRSGFYKSSYVDPEGNTNYLASTQFEPTHARRAFPSWDEPSFKATFSIIITAPTELNVLSNTVGTVRIDDGVTRTTEFEISPIMATYLNAIVISNLTCSDGESIDNAPYRVCSRDEVSESRAWALEMGPKIMKAFDEYTAYNYSSAMMKMDQAAVPTYSGAMENWGLVLYGESGLLWDPEESSNANKQSIAAVIAHEFAHSWFGNLVTCNWWSVTFLNEGFAQLLQYNILDDVLPEWELRKQFVVAALHSILSTDSYSTALALESEASTPSEVSSKFGSITYVKGASVLRMVDHVLGADNFRNGLRNYLVQNEYTSTLPEKLWSILSESVDPAVSDLPADLSTVLQGWIETSGYPLLTVTTSGENVIVTQERFLLSGTDTTSKWYVPVTFTTSVDSNKFGRTNPEGWLTPTSDLTIDLPAGADWIILNNQQTGYYRVNYELSLWDKIVTALSGPNFSDIPDINRAQIVDDVFNLARAEKILYSKAFEIIDFLRNDDSYFSWYPAFAGFNYLIRTIGDESLLGRTIVRHLSNLMENLYQSVPISNLDESDQIYTLKQVSAVTWACRLGKADCVRTVQDIFRQYKEEDIRPSKNLKSIVYCNALRYSTDPSDWEFLWEKYVSTNVATEQSTLITALGCTRDETILNNYLIKSVDSTSGIRSQDANSVFSAVYGGNSVGIDVALQFLLQYHQAIENNYQGLNALANIVSGLAERFTRQDQVAQLENFIETADLSDSFVASATQSLETARANLAWIEEFQDDLIEYYGLIDDSIDEAESTLPEYRLSSNFKPSHYHLHLYLSDEAFTASGTGFSGTVEIHFTVQMYTDLIKLHASAVNIAIQSIELDGVVIPSETYSVNSTTDILTIAYETGLEANTPYVLKFEYDGTFGGDTRGFYKSSYLNSENVRRYLVTTQFEPVHARRAFPCFDEPQYKATFRVNITYPSGLNAKSNTPGTIIDENLETGLATIQFDQTPITPTYLIAFIVSDFTCTAGLPVGTVPYQVCSRSNTDHLRGVAVDIGPGLLSSLGSFTAYSYGEVMAKMDQFAIPDFASGAMENWGIITYRESNLLWDPLESTNSVKQSIILVIAHEFTHMWFGNLVTCKWWSETFLNEGFAQYFQYYSAHDVLPDWGLDKQFVVRVHQPILQTDSYLTSQPLQSPASTPAQISNKFASVSYSKGASIIRMVEHFLGSENFWAGLQTYLRTNEFSSAKPEDLYAAWSLHIDPSISKLPADLETVMENWVKKAGFPLLYVSLDANNVVISQQRFLITGEDNTAKWYVPISYTTSVDVYKFASTAPSAWLTPDSDLSLEYPSGAEWIILNNHESAYYRVNYADTLWDGLATALSSENFSGIPELNRAQVADDLFNFVKLDIVPYSRVLKTLEFLENDVSYYPWYTVYSELNTFFDRIGLHSYIGRAVREHIGRAISKFYDSVPISVIDEENQLYTLSQTIVVNLACRLGNENCGEHMREIFSEYRHNDGSLPKNLISVALCNGIRHSVSRDDWDFLWDKYTSATSDRSTLITALGCSTDEEILTEYLSRAINRDSGLSNSELSSIFSSVYAHHTGHGVAFKFFVENHEAIYDYFQSATTVGNIIRGIAARFTSPEELAELETFVASGELHANLASAAQAAIATVQSNVQWVERYQNDLYEYYGLEPETTTTPTTTTPTTTTPTTTTPATTTPTTTTPATTTPTTTTPATTTPTTTTPTTTTPTTTTPTTTTPTTTTPTTTTPTTTTPTTTTPTTTTPTTTTPTTTTPTTTTPTTTTPSTTTDGALTLSSSIILILTVVFVNQHYLN